MPVYTVLCSVYTVSQRVSKSSTFCYAYTVSATWSQEQQQQEQYQSPVDWLWEAGKNKKHF